MYYGVLPWKITWLLLDPHPFDQRRPRVADRTADADERRAIVTHARLGKPRHTDPEQLRGLRRRQQHDRCDVLISLQHPLLFDMLWAAVCPSEQDRREIDHRFAFAEELCRNWSSLVQAAISACSSSEY